MKAYVYVQVYKYVSLCVCVYICTDVCTFTHRENMDCWSVCSLISLPSIFAFNPSPKPLVLTDKHQANLPESSQRERGELYLQILIV